jgi:acyl-CoA thioester hydrolase
MAADADSRANDHLASYPIVVRIPVQWGEMDAYGHVNNAVFFRYFESARVAYLRACGFTDSYDRDRIGAILHSTSCRFRQPLFYPDTVLVGARAAEVGEDRFVHAYEAVSLTHGTVVAEGTGVIVSFDYERREKAPLPAAVRRRIDEMEGGG